MNKLASELLNSKNQSHVFHLRTNSYAIHITMEEYYTAITNELDRLVEAYQGIFGDVEFDTEYKIFKMK